MWLSKAPPNELRDTFANVYITVADLIKGVTITNYDFRFARTSNFFSLQLI